MSAVSPLGWRARKVSSRGTSNSDGAVPCRLQGRTRLGEAIVRALLLVGDQGEDVVTGQLVAAVQEAQLDDEPKADHRPAQLLDQANGRGRRPARGQDVVDDDGPFAGGDGIAVDLEQIGAVLE